MENQPPNIVPSSRAIHSKEIRSFRLLQLLKLTFLNKTSWYTFMMNGVMSIEVSSAQELNSGDFCRIIA
jgi:hypothetical protein